MRLFLLLLTLVMTLTPVSLGAQDNSIVVVANVEAKVDQLKRKEVIGLFLGRLRFFPNGKASKAYENSSAEETRKEFYEGLTGKDISTVDVYWARLSYSGKVQPPVKAKNLTEQLQLVEKDTAAISYMKYSDFIQSKSEHLRIVYVLEAK